MANNVTIFDWDSAIENDGQEFVLLDPGDYSFTVTAFERAQFAGSDKSPACPMAKLTLNCTDSMGNTAQIYDALFLNSRNEWRLCQFFTAIGQRQHGEKLVPNWNKVLGATGTCTVGYDDRNKDEKGNPKYNRVTKYLEPAGGSAAAPAKKWTLGK